MTRECWIKCDRILRFVDRVAWMFEAFGLTFAQKKILGRLVKYLEKLLLSNIGNRFDLF